MKPGRSWDTSNGPTRPSSGLRPVRSETDAEARVGHLDLVEHLPRAAVLPAPTSQIQIREGLGDCAQGRVVGGPGALPARAVVYREAAAVNERALGEVGNMRIALTIEVREETGEDPEDEVGRQMKGGFPLAALEPDQPL